MLCRERSGLNGIANALKLADQMLGLVVQSLCALKRLPEDVGVNRSTLLRGLENDRLNAGRLGDKSILRNGIRARLGIGLTHRQGASATSGKRPPRISYF